MERQEIQVKCEILKKLGFQYDPYVYEASSPNSQQCDPIELTSTSAKKKHLTRSQLRDLALCIHETHSCKLEDGYPHVFTLSGIPCFAIANFMSGQVEVKISMPTMTKMLQHDFNSTQKKIFGAAELEKQIGKLFFIIKRKQKKDSKDMK